MQAFCDLSAQLCPFFNAHLLVILKRILFVLKQSIRGLYCVRRNIVPFQYVASCSIVFILLQSKGRIIIRKIFTYFIQNFRKDAAFNKLFTIFVILRTVNKGISLAGVTMHVDKCHKVLSILIFAIFHKLLQSRYLRVNWFISLVKGPIEIIAEIAWINSILLVRKLPKTTPSGLSMGMIFTMAIERKLSIYWLFFASSSSFIKPLMI